VGRVMQVAVSVAHGLGIVLGLGGLPARPDSLRPQCSLGGLTSSPERQKG
jgi:hypothetical protein